MPHVSGSSEIVCSGRPFRGASIVWPTSMRLRVSVQSVDAEQICTVMLSGGVVCTSVTAIVPGSAENGCVSPVQLPALIARAVPMNVSVRDTGEGTVGDDLLQATAAAAPKRRAGQPP